MHMGISKNAKLLLQNVLTCRRKCTVEDAQILLKYAEATIKESGAVMTCNTVFSTYSIEKNLNGEEITDLEIILPLNKEINPPSGFSFMHKLELNNALKLRYCGKEQNISDAIRKLIYLMKFADMKASTGIYTSRIKPNCTNEVIFEIYIGVE